MSEGRELFVRMNCSGCHGGRAGGGMGPSLRDEDWLYGNTDQQIFSTILEGRAHGMPSWGTEADERRGVEARGVRRNRCGRRMNRIPLVKGSGRHAQMQSGGTDMKRLNALRAACVALTLASAAAACSKAESQQNQPANPGTTQPGSSAEQSRGSQPGAAKADCSNLPSADDLKKWLRSTPSESEAGRLIYRQDERATVVNRRGEICATAVPPTIRPVHGLAASPSRRPRPTLPTRSAPMTRRYPRRGSIR